MVDHFERIARAILYIQAHFQEQPSLEAVAAQVNLSPFHFQRLFTQWAGTSPKKFLQYLSVRHAKEHLNAQASVLDAALSAGLSGPGRLHDCFVRLEAMTPGEYKNGGLGLHIRYSLVPTPFGHVVIASTDKGICQLRFCEDFTAQDGAALPLLLDAAPLPTLQAAALDLLRQQFPRARYTYAHDDAQAAALRSLHACYLPNAQPHAQPNTAAPAHAVALHLKASAFQIKVWEALLRIPAAGLSSYGAIASAIAQPRAARAVGTAIGSNPMACLIPCHRVIQASGALGGYRWGLERKAALLRWEYTQQLSR